MAEKGEGLRACAFEAVGVAGGEGDHSRAGHQGHADEGFAAGKRGGLAVEREVADGVTDEGGPVAEQGVDGARDEAGGALQIEFGAEADAFEAQQAGNVVLQAPGRVWRADEREDGVLNELHEPIGGSASAGSCGAVTAGLVEHGRHVVGDGFPVEAARRLEHGVEFGMCGEPAGIRAQEGCNQTVAILGLPLQTYQRCVIQNYGHSPFIRTEPTA